jgi:hypothetical protein
VALATERHYSRRRFLIRLDIQGFRKNVEGQAVTIITAAGDRQGCCLDDLLATLIS